MTAVRQPFPGWILMLLGLFWAAAHAWMVQGWMPGSFLALVPFSLGGVRAPRCLGAMTFAFVGGLGLFLAAESFFGLVSRGGWALLAFWQAATLLPVAIALRWMDPSDGEPAPEALAKQFADQSKIRSQPLFNLPQRP